jgi:imidazolonepropionase-like amidohydrolase
VIRIAASIFCAAALAASLSPAPASQQAPPAPEPVRAFTGARLIDPVTARVTEKATLVVRGGRIEAAGPATAVRIPAGATPQDLAGQFVVPGFISTHVHVSDVNGDRPRAYTADNTLRQLAVFARYGITTLWSLDGERAPAFAARDSQDTPALDRARLYVAGSAIVGATPEDARRMVATVAALKPDVIKIRVDDNLGTTPKMPPAVYRAVIDEAHRRGLRVAAHLFYLDDAKDLLRAGIDVVAHSVRDKDIDDEFIALMKARSVPYCPTLTREVSTFVYGSTPAFFSDPFFLREADRDVVARLQQPAAQEAMRSSKTAQAYRAGLEVARRNLKRATDAGIVIAMGTDSGPLPERFQGYFEHLEMEMMVESGLTPMQAIVSATGDAARCHRNDDLGVIADGKVADLLVLGANPVENIRNLRSIEQVWVGGRKIQ